MDLDQTPRIAPLEPPFEPAEEEQLRAMMPPGVPPIALFRTFVRNLPMTAAMQPWGRHQLGRSFAVGLREREIVIDRTCARCGCEYEWGVHVAFFAERAGLDAAQVRSLTHGGPADPCWVDERERLLIRLVDELHDSLRRQRGPVAGAPGSVRRGAAARPAPALRLVPRHQLHGPSGARAARGWRTDVRLGALSRRPPIGARRRLSRR